MWCRTHMTIRVCPLPMFENRAKLHLTKMITSYHVRHSSREWAHQLAAVQLNYSEEPFPAKTVWFSHKLFLKYARDQWSWWQRFKLQMQCRNSAR
jgi:hypothetical protein